MTIQRLAVDVSTDVRTPNTNTYYYYFYYYYYYYY